MAPQPPLLRRLALPLGLSLVGHAMLAGLICLLYEPMGSGNDSGGDDRPELCLRLGWVEQAHASGHQRPPAEKLVEGTSVEISGKLVSPPIAPTPADAATGSRPGAQGTGNNTDGLEPGKRGLGRGLLCVAGTARRIVYLVDRSISMGPSGALATAVEEVAASLSSLPPNALFQVIPYNRMAEPLELNGRRDLAAASPATIEQAIELLEHVQPAGPTDSAAALRCAFLLRPDVVFLLTDADELPAIQLPTLMRLRGNAVLHVIELSHDQGGPPDGPLARFACGPSDTYRRVLPGR